MILCIFSLSKVQLAEFLSSLTSRDIGSEDDFPQIVPPQEGLEDRGMESIVIGEQLPPRKIKNI